jgi:uncharacterized membrane protein
MSKLQKWKPFGLSLIATPFLLLVGIASAGSGHGDYLWTKVLFPYTMFSTIFLHSITTVFVVIALAQFPVYGLVLCLIHEKKYMGFAIVAVHAVFAALCLLLIGEGFN